MRTRTRQARSMRKLRSLHPEGQQPDNSEQTDGRTIMADDWPWLLTACARQRCGCNAHGYMSCNGCCALLCHGSARRPPPAVGSPLSAAAARSIPPLRLDSLCCTLVSLLLHWCRLLLSIDATRSTLSAGPLLCSAPLPLLAPLRSVRCCCCCCCWEWFGSIRTRPSSALLFATWLRPLPSAI